MIFKDLRVTELLGIEHPILQGGMAWISDHKLAGAVSNAGGLGVIAAGNLSPEELEMEIEKTRELTSRPFGVNVMLLSPNAPELIDLVCSKRVPVVTTGAGNPGPYISKLKSAGVRVVPVVASAGLARRMEKAGADAVIAEGMEAGGHIGKVTTMALVPAVVDVVSIPVIAAGGIADGRGVIAALALGACGVQLGTRFLCTEECTVHLNYKEKLLSSSELDPVITGTITGHPVRALRNSLTRKLEEVERRGGTFEEFEMIAVGGLRRAAKEGDVKDGSVMAGQICAIVRDVKPVSKVFKDIINEIEETLRRIGGVEG